MKLCSPGLGLIATFSPTVTNWTVAYDASMSNTQKADWTLPNGGSSAPDVTCDYSAVVADAAKVSTPTPSTTGQNDQLVNGPYVFDVTATGADGSTSSSTLTVNIDAAAATIGNDIAFGAYVTTFTDTVSVGAGSTSGIAAFKAGGGTKLQWAKGTDRSHIRTILTNFAYGGPGYLTISTADSATVPLLNFEVQTSSYLKYAVQLGGHDFQGRPVQAIPFGSTSCSLVQPGYISNSGMLALSTSNNLDFSNSKLLYVGPDSPTAGVQNCWPGRSMLNGVRFINSSYVTLDKVEMNWVEAPYVDDPAGSSNITITNNLLRHFSNNCFFIANAINWVVSDTICMSPSEAKVGFHIDYFQMTLGFGPTNLQVNRMIGFDADATAESQGIDFGSPTIASGTITGCPGACALVLTDLISPNGVGASTQLTCATCTSVISVGACTVAPPAGQHCVNFAVTSPDGNFPTTTKFYSRLLNSYYNNIIVAGRTNYCGSFDSGSPVGYLVNKHTCVRMNIGYDVPSTGSDVNQFLSYGPDWFMMWADPIVWPSPTGFTGFTNSFVYDQITGTGRLATPQIFTPHAAITSPMPTYFNIGGSTFPSAGTVSMPGGSTVQVAKVINGCACDAASYFANGEPNANIGGVSSPLNGISYAAFSALTSAQKTAWMSASYAAWAALTPSQAIAALRAAVTPKASGPLNPGGGSTVYGALTTDGYWDDGSGRYPGDFLGDLGE